MFNFVFIRFINRLENAAQFNENGQYTFVIYDLHKLKFVLSVSYDDLLYFLLYFNEFL